MLKQTRAPFFTVGHYDASQPTTLKIRIVPLAEHDVDCAPLVLQRRIARNHADVLSAKPPW